MKKIVYVSIVLFALTASAQKREKGTIELTPKIGFSSSNYYASEKISNSSLGGLNLGIDLDYFFNNRWSLRSGLLFQKMGSSYTLIGYEAKDKINYLTIPINANWHFGSTRKWNLNFGPSLGFVTDASFEFRGQIFNAEDYVNSFQFGLNYGVGYKIEVSNKFSILLDYQGMTGLTESLKGTGYNIKNTYGAFNIGGVLKL